MKNSIAKLLTTACFATVFFTGTVSAQILRVDSVKVDTTISSDSSWYDGYDILQQRLSRDCRISFIPQGEGKARMFLAMSVDSGKTWSQSPNPLTVMNNALAATFNTGQKATITVRVLGGDRPGVVFRLTARQDAPVLAGNPKIRVLGFMTDLTPGANVGAGLGVLRLPGLAVHDGFCTLAKVYWDALGDGTIDDSTTGAKALAWTWMTRVPAGAKGQRRVVIARAIDKNNLWSAPETLSVQFGLQRPIVMKNIPAGTFKMGETGVAEPVHQVTLSAFKMQETEVTQEQYAAVMGMNPATYNTGTDAPLRPVESLGWYDAVTFCNALSLVYGLSAAYDTSTWTLDTSKSGYRLPTEAQWEYACRGGTTTPYWWGIDTNGIWTRAWIARFDNTHPVATKTANPFGLYDMLGNVWEWNNDLYDIYEAGAVTNPAGPATGSLRILRGGCWASGPGNSTSAWRYYGVPVGGGNGFGFRVVLPVR